MAEEVDVAGRAKSRRPTDAATKQDCYSREHLCVVRGNHKVLAVLGQEYDVVADVAISLVLAVETGLVVPGQNLDRFYVPHVDVTVTVLGTIKRIDRPMLGFKDFSCARRLIAGIETMHMVKKGQLECPNGPALSAADQFYSLVV